MVLTTNFQLNNDDLMINNNFKHILYVKDIYRMFWCRLEIDRPVIIVTLKI